MGSKTSDTNIKNVKEIANKAMMIFFNSPITETLLFIALGLFIGEIIGNFFATFKLKPKKLYLKKKSPSFLFNYFLKLLIKNTKYPVNKAFPDFLSLFSESIIVIRFG